MFPVQRFLLQPNKVLKLIQACLRYKIFTIIIDIFRSIHPLNHSRLCVIMFTLVTFSLQSWKRKIAIFRRSQRSPSQPWPNRQRKGIELRKKLSFISKFSLIKKASLELKPLGNLFFSSSTYLKTLTKLTVFMDWFCETNLNIEITKINFRHKTCRLKMENIFNDACKSFSHTPVHCIRLIL